LLPLPMKFGTRGSSLETRTKWGLDTPEIGLNSALI
jgi:hypothetical protein